MELKDRKRIINKGQISSKNLPGFDTGSDSGEYYNHNNDLVSGGIKMPWYAQRDHWEDVAPRSLTQTINPFLNRMPYAQQMDKALRPHLTKDTKLPLKNKPTYSNNYGQIINTGVSFAGDVVNAFSSTKSADDMLVNAGRSTSNVAGFGYEKQNYVDENAERSELRKENFNNTLKTVGSGAALGGTVGSIIPGVGTAIGAGVGALIGGITDIFGGSSRRRKQERAIKEAQEYALRVNTFNRSGALTKSLLQDYALKYGNEENQVLYGAQNGKDAYTSFGKTATKPNARVAGGESIIDNLDDVNNTTGTIVRDGKLGVDGPKAYLKNSTVVLGTLKDWRNGRSFMAQAAPYTQALEMINNKYEKHTNRSVNNMRGNIGRLTDELQLQTINRYKIPIVAELKDLADQLKYQHDVENYNYLMSAKCGKDRLPGFAKGYTGWPIDLLGAGIGLYQFLNASNQRIKAPRTYIGNPYVGTALQGLASLKINPYPIMSQMRNQERRNLYAINRAGGLSGAQKAYANIATGIGTQNNIAKLNTDIQALNNQYLNNYYSSLLNAGQAERQAMMAANQYDLDYYSKAHAAREQMKQVGMANTLAAIQQGYANWFKKNQFDNMYALYAQDVT